ncbi:unnamed protein product [Clonostachys rhizophaga]|uniref:C3H1-type domain-containing protein n=1 Tax=Clonostachys rhizophaga TaxID=160324 RepID=A0A9N9VEG4_9HYPO|nr:unnamed protein product [Clonostachys rhizophaga]
MQSWSNQGQNGTDGHDSWQSNFNFSNQNAQYDHSQSWSQPMPGQDYGRQMNSSDLATNFLHDPHSFSNYDDNHGSFDLGPQYPSQDVLDPAFANIQPELYNQQDKLGLSGDNIHQMEQLQRHPHSQAQGFSNHDYSTFAPQHEQSFPSPPSQFSQPQVMPQASKPQSHTPVQSYSNVQPNNFAQNQLRPSQPSPGQHQQHQQAYNPNTSYGHVNGHGAQYQPSPVNHTNYQIQQPVYQQQQQQPQAQSPAQSHPHAQHPSYASPKPFTYQQQPQHAPAHGFPQPGLQQNGQPRLSQPVVSDPHPSHPIPAEHAPVQLQPTEAPAKKRKRTVNSTTDSPSLENSPQRFNSPMESTVRKAEEIDALIPPTPSPEDLVLLQQFNKRPKGAQAKFPPIKGLPYLANDATIKLPVPKSYDKLAPLVALPPRSKRSIVPELGYDLPCEIQGKFTNLYRPAFDKIGLDERRIEAKTLLDEFDRSMKSLGKKRPKYTEYPHAFKEQLKADEASKNKAEKKAKREQEEERKDERNKPVRPPTRPSDPIEAARWDAIGIVYIDPSETKTNSLVASRVQQAGDFFIKLRSEMNQAKQELDQATKESKTDPELQELKKIYERKKQALFKVLDDTVEHADDSVLNNLGGHHKLVLSLINVLIFSIKAGDFSGELPKVVLELFTHFQITRKIAETTNFDTVRKRFAEKGDSDVRELVREISAKIKKYLRLIEESTGYTGTSAASRAAKAPKPAAGSTVKRGRDDDTSAETRIVKKVAVEPGSGSLSKKLAQPKLQLTSASKTTAAKAAASSLQLDKQRTVAKPLSKAEPVTGSDHAKTSSDDKPRLEHKKPLAKVEKTKPNPAKADPRATVPKTAAPPSASSSALSGIASLLDSINAPRPVTPPAAKEGKESELPETAEEKAKRLRKEARRKLRVTWKPDSELVQVKTFEKEEGEDLGRDVNMIRDAADDRAEGMVLKRGVDVEEEDEDEDIPYQPWLGPILSDLSSLSEEARKKNYTTRGGQVSFSTEEQKRIAERGQRELMAIYADPSDIPPSPKSPPPEDYSPVDPKVGHFPTEGSAFEEIQLRWRDGQQMGVDGALYSANQRLNAKSGSSDKLESILGSLRKTPSQSQGSSSSGASKRPAVIDTNVPLVMGVALTEQVLSLLRSDAAKNWKDPQPVSGDPNRIHQYSDPATQVAGNAVELLASSLAGKPFPATAPPSWLSQDEERVREWWLCYNKESAIRHKRAEEEHGRAEAEANALRAAAAATAAASTTTPAQASNPEWAAYYAQQQQAYAPYMAILQQMNAGQNQNSQAQPSQQSQVTNDQLQSILAAMNQQPQAQQQQQPSAAQPQNPASFLNPNDTSYQQLMMLTQLAQGNMQGQSSGDREHDREHDRERNWDRHDRNDDYGRDRYRDKDSKKKKPGPTTIHKPPNAALIGTKPCSFWQQGKCARGEHCTFRHD